MFIWGIFEINIIWEIEWAIWKLQRLYIFHFATPVNLWRNKLL